MKVVDAPTGTRVQTKSRHHGAKAKGIVVRKEDIHNYPDPNKPTNWTGRAVIKVDEGCWLAHWEKSHKPYYRWASDYDWEICTNEVTVIVKTVTFTSDTGFCSCESPEVVTSHAGGKSFLFCRSCKKERKG